ncbi:MAG: KH domain-containing protein [Candidatus Hydrogenedentota bacterium]|nr:MAG: KH domain-containing protein [Candidatus Hydrogenedentota bacterium]
MYMLETHAKNDKEAIEKSAEFLGVSPDQIEVRLYKKGGGGFLGLGSKEPSVYHVYPVEGKTPEEVVIRGTLLTILHKMGYQAAIKKMERTSEGKMYVELESPDAGNIIGKRGKTMETIQFLANILVEKFTGTQPKILLDLENYRERRAKYLAELARKVADSAIRAGRRRSIDPLNPYERRIIHMELQDDDRVSTESEGVGTYKKVWIIPAKSENKALVVEETVTVREVDEEEIPENVQNQIEEELPPEMYEEESTPEDPPQPKSNESYPDFA